MGRDAGTAVLGAAEGKPRVAAAWAAKIVSLRRCLLATRICITRPWGQGLLGSSGGLSQGCCSGLLLFGLGPDAWLVPTAMPWVPGSRGGLLTALMLTGRMLCRMSDEDTFSKGRFGGETPSSQAAKLVKSLGEAKAKAVCLPLSIMEGGLAGPAASWGRASACMGLAVAWPGCWC